MREVLIKKARAFLDEGYTCALLKGEQVHLSKERGISVLNTWIETGVDSAQAVAADKVVGKAAAYFYVLLGVAFVHANTISEGAAEVFERFGVEYSYGELVAAIRNRKGDGFCPMEQAVWEATEPAEARRLILLKLEELKG